MNEQRVLKSATDGGPFYWAWAEDQERWIGKFDTLKEAVDDARATNEDENEGVWVGVGIPLKPENLIDLERVFYDQSENCPEDCPNDDDWGGYWGVTADQWKDLNERVRTLIREWIAENGFPSWSQIDDMVYIPFEVGEGK